MVLAEDLGIGGRRLPQIVERAGVLLLADVVVKPPGTSMTGWKASVSRTSRSAVKSDLRVSPRTGFTSNEVVEKNRISGARLCIVSSWATGFTTLGPVTPAAISADEAMPPYLGLPLSS